MENKKNKTEAEKVIDITNRADIIDDWEIYCFRDGTGHYIKMTMIGIDGKKYRVSADIDSIEED